MHGHAASTKGTHEQFTDMQIYLPSPMPIEIFSRHMPSCTLLALRTGHISMFIVESEKPLLPPGPHQDLTKKIANHTRFDYADILQAHGRPPRQLKRVTAPLSSACQFSLP